MVMWRLAAPVSAGGSRKREHLDEIVGAERRGGRRPAPGPRPRARRWWRGAAPGRAGGGRRWRTRRRRRGRRARSCRRRRRTTLPTHGLPWAMRPSCSRARFAHASSRTASVTRSGSTSSRRRPRRVPHDEEGVVAPPRQAGGDQVGHPGAGAAGEQHDVGLVLDLVLAGERQRRFGVLVPDEPPELGEQAGVGRVPPHDLDRQLGLGPGRVVGAAPRLLRREPQTGRVDAEVTQRVGHLFRGRRGRRGAEAQMRDGRRAPGEDDAGDHGAREALGQGGGRQRAEPERGLEQAAGRTGQVRPRGPQHRRARGHQHHREVGGVAVERLARVGHRLGHVHRGGQRRAHEPRPRRRRRPRSPAGEVAAPPARRRASPPRRSAPGDRGPPRPVRGRRAGWRTGRRRPPRSW